MKFLTKLRSFYMDKKNFHKKTNPNSKKNIKYIFEANSKDILHHYKNLSVETVNTIKDFKKFYNFSFELYKDDLNWVAPFWIEHKDFFKKNNPFWKHSDVKLFIAYKNGEIVGRIAAIVDNLYCDIQKEKIGLFGFFECIKDYKCAEALFQTAQNWLSSKGMVKMQGPIDGRIDIGCGFLYSGFNKSQSLLSSYSPEYYIAFAEKFDMIKTRDFLMYYIDLKKPIPKKFQEKARQCAASGVTIRAFNRLRTQKELKWWIIFFLESFADHWGYVPVSPDEVKSRFGIKQLRWFVDARLFLIAEFNNSPVAYIWSTPDYNQIFRKMNGQFNLFQMFQFFFKKKQINKGKLHFIGIKKEFRDQNIGSYLNYESLVEMKNRGYLYAEVGLIDEENTVAHATISITGAKPYKKFRVFEKNLKQI